MSTFVLLKILATDSCADGSTLARRKGLMISGVRMGMVAFVVLILLTAGAGEMPSKVSQVAGASLANLQAPSVGVLEEADGVYTYPSPVDCCGSFSLTNSVGASASVTVSIRCR
jgi:hypothetical protein